MSDRPTITMVGPGEPGMVVTLAEDGTWDCRDERTCRMLDERTKLYLEREYSTSDGDSETAVYNEMLRQFGPNAKEQTRPVVTPGKPGREY